MAFGYAFVDLDNEQKAERRVLLDRYAAYAQWSVLVVFALFQFSFFLSWIAEQALKNARPSSPSFNKRGGVQFLWLLRFRQRLRGLRWWLRKPVYRNWGTRGEWIFGSTWTIWLLFLCMNHTGPDYMHLTKRFGIVGASQMPLHYLIATRSPYSPVQWLTRLSHEQLKAYHQVLGRIIYLLFSLHAIFYLNFFIRAGFLRKRITDQDVILGLVSIFLFSILSTTALGYMRRWNYRIFYTTHIIIAVVLIPALYFHVHHIRLYIIEVGGIVLLQFILRQLSSRQYDGTIRSLPGTNMIEIRIPLTSLHRERYWRPGQHVYLRLPSKASSNIGAIDLSLLKYQSNPFTIASIPARDKALLLVARTLKGNTREIAKLARSLSSETGASGSTPTIPLTLEGPFGASSWLPDFSTFEHVLFVAGGVGATFVVPIYRTVAEEASQSSIPKVRFVWAVKRLAETKWAFPTSDENGDELQLQPHGSSVEVYVTRSGAELREEESGSDIEMAEDVQLLSDDEEMDNEKRGMTIQSGRPNLSGIVDDVVGKANGRVAVIACGPRSLTERLGDSVEKWIGTGADVFWHEETFGW